jgi:hypothetical protein
MSIGDSVKPSQAYERLDEIYHGGAIDDFNFRTGRLTGAWSSALDGFEAVAPISRFMKNHPDVDYGAPGNLVHFIETFQGRSKRLYKKPFQLFCGALAANILMSIVKCSECATTAPSFTQGETS